MINVYEINGFIYYISISISYQLSKNIYNRINCYNFKWEDILLNYLRHYQSSGLTFFYNNF